MQAELNTHSNASTHIRKSRALPSCARFAHGHNAKRLYGCETRVVFVFEEKVFGFPKEMIASGSKVGGIGATCRVVGQVTRIGTYGVHEQRGAVFVATCSEVFVETLAAEQNVEWVAPGEVKIEQMVDELKIVGHDCPCCPSSVCQRSVVAPAAACKILIFRHKTEAGRVSKMSNLTRRAGHGLPKQQTQVQFQARNLRGGVKGEGHGLLPCFRNGRDVELRIFSQMLDQIVYVVIGKSSEGVNDEFGVKRVPGAGWGNNRGIALRSSGSGDGCGWTRLGATTFAVRIVVAFSLVDSCARCTYRRATITLSVGSQQPATAIGPGRLQIKKPCVRGPRRSTSNIKPCYSLTSQVMKTLTLDLRFLHGTHADCTHRRLLALDSGCACKLS